MAKDAAGTILPAGHSVGSVTLPIPAGWGSTGGTQVVGSSAISFNAPGTAGDYTYTVKWAATSYTCASSPCLSTAGAFSIIVHVVAPSDSTPPVITVTCNGAACSSNWYTVDVIVDWTVTDAESSVSIDSGCVDQTLSSDTTGTTLSCTAHSAGGSSTSSVTIKIDKTPPTFEACPVAGPFILNTGTQTVGPIGASDATSGLNAGASTLTGSVDTSSVGTKTVTFTAVDNAGNSATKQCTYSVQYIFLGFFQPIDNLPVVNAVKAGSTIPVKWALKDGQGNYVTDLAAFAGLTSASFACAAGAPSDLIEEIVDNSGKTLLRYDTLANQFIYNWQTAKNWAGSCRRMVLTLNDGTRHYADFTFK
jgi:hypothetical protein